MSRKKRDPEIGRRSESVLIPKKISSGPVLPLSPSDLALVLATSFCVALILTSSLSVPVRRYHLGDIAERNIKAKRDFLVLDKQATEERRKAAERSVPLVFDFDKEALNRIIGRLHQAFESMRQILSQHSVTETPVHGRATGATETGLYGKTAKDFHKLALSYRKDFEEKLGIRVPDSVYEILIERKFSDSIERRVGSWLEGAMKNGVIATYSIPLEFADRSHSYLIRDLPFGGEVVLPSLRYYRSVEEAKAYIEMQRAIDEGDQRELKAAAFLALHLVRPNIVFNKAETKYRRTAAGKTVKPVYIQVKRNEMLVREGQKIGTEELLKLKGYQESVRGLPWSTTFLALFSFTVLYFLVVMRVSSRTLPAFTLEFRDKIFLSALLVLLLLVARGTAWISETSVQGSILADPRSLIYATPIATGAMLTSIFLSMTVAFVFALTSSIYTAILFSCNLNLFVYFFLGSLIGARGVRPCRNRMVPFKAGILVGVINLAVVMVYALLGSESVLSALLISGLLAFLGGIFSAVLVTGFTPLVELLFDYTTDIKLLELANMDQPLLKELMVQAPGTYHHSIIVGNLVERAAQAIGANSLLAKVAAYYHDIGKVKKPLYFIENQLGCENRHEKLAPSMSSLILISHVKEGVELARRYRLGRPIQDIIQQHHGTSLISYFYQKALDAREKTQSTKGTELPPVNIDDYRYPGPKPQTKEAGLVMLADVVEAACRSLPEPTPARIQGLVNKLINRMFTDGQLDDCELTLRDLHRIAKCFIQMLTTLHHKRVEYPDEEQPGSRDKERRDGRDSNKRESKSGRSASSPDREDGESDLKRLGLH